MFSTTSSVLPDTYVSAHSRGASSCSDSGNTVRNRDNLLAQALMRHLCELNRQIEFQFDRDSSDSGRSKIDSMLGKVTEILCVARSDQKPGDQGHCEAAACEFTKHLFALSKQIDHARSKDVTLQKQHARQILLMPILPLYLRSSSQSLATTLSHAMQIMWEHRIVLTLNHLLYGDLVLAIEDAKLQHHTPIASAETVLNIELASVVSALRRNMPFMQNAVESDSRLIVDPSSPPLTAKQRDGYWTIASQWIQQREAISIPADLAVGAVSWPRLRNHWNELFACLLDGDRSAQGNSESLAKQIKAEQIETSKFNSNTLVASLKSEPVTVETNLVATNLDTVNVASASVAPKGDTSIGVLASETEKANTTTANEPVVDSYPDIIEIRSSNDPELARNLDVHLQRCRERSGSLALVVVQCKSEEKSNSAGQSGNAKGSLTSWQLDIISALQSSLEHRKMYGFHTTDGEIALIMEDVDRSEVTSLVRKVIEQEAVVDDHETRLLDQAGLPLYSGIACVHAPSKSFRLAQLTESAWRCLDASTRQPPGSVKSIEVY
ncbi:MAG: hypothetical protein NTW52_10730 [Planctomycetota bacterium]|nr:hypothetical protein [Planctomycetota bacterium]